MVTRFGAIFMALVIGVVGVVLLTGASTEAKGEGKKAGLLVTPTSTVIVRCPDEHFKDVCAGDYFYEHVLDLNDLGAIAGYNSSPPCDNAAEVPCFKPANWSTRGQIAKVISLAAGFGGPVFAQTFADVVPDHTFYAFIERMAAHGVVDGYACGGVGEPCVAPGNLPYFRPGDLVSRGQIAKMASIAFNFTQPMNGQHFEDVVPGSPFYEYVERMATWSIISGYECGGYAEPCIAPNNYPYFRPAQEVSRGQTAKIINLARRQGPTPTVTPVLGPCDNIPPAVDMEITPSNCEPAGTVITFVGSGFSPIEMVSIYLRSPDGAVFAGTGLLAVDENGLTDPLTFWIEPDWPLGVWTVYLRGLGSNHLATGPYMALAP